MAIPKDRLAVVHNAHSSFVIRYTYVLGTTFFPIVGCPAYNNELCIQNVQTERIYSII